jgi:hypothetical protein
MAGIITEIHLDTANGGTFELIGKTYEWIAQSQRTLPGEFVHNSAYDTVTVVKSFIGNHYVKRTDQFAPYVPASYTSTNLFGLTPGTWAADTDANGINSNVVSNSTGTGAVLIDTTGFQYDSTDPLFTYYIEAFARLKPSGTSTTNAGQLGIGFSASPTLASNCVVLYVNAKWNTTTLRYDLDAYIDLYLAGVRTGRDIYTNVLTNVDDPDGYIPLQLQFLNQNSPAPIVQFTVNGTRMNPIGTGSSNSFNPSYPLFMFGAPATGTAVGYYTNLLTGNRPSDHWNSWFGYGTFGTPVHKFRATQSIPPTFLDIWTLAATLEGWYWRLTPVSMVTNAATFYNLATVDFNTAALIGTDHSGDIRFVEGDNLLSIRQQGNADTFGSDLQFNGYADSSSGGVHNARNLTAMLKYGWFSGVSMSLNVQDYVGLYRQGGQASTNRGTPGASYVAKVLRDAGTADKFRELDYITIHAPSIGINNLKLLVLAYTFDEGQPTQTLTLGQYGVADMVVANRMMPGLNQMAGLFKNR